MRTTRLKLMVVVMAVSVVVIGIILGSLANTAKGFATDMVSRQSTTANFAFNHMLENYKSEALERAEMIAGSGDIIGAIEAGDHAALLAALNNMSTGLDLITLCDADGNVLARTHNDKTGDSVLSQQAISVALNTGKGISTIEPGTVIGLSTRGSAAIKNAQGTIIGALTCGHDLSQEKYIDFIKQQNNCEATFFSGDERMSNTLLNESGQRDIGTKADAEIAQAVLEGKENYTGTVEFSGKNYAAYYSPLIVDGQAIGMLFTGVTIDDVLASEVSLYIMIIVAGLLLLLSLAVTIIIIVSTSKKAYWYEAILDCIPFPISVTDMNMNWTFINRPVEQMLNVQRASITGKRCSNWGAAICNTSNCGVECLRRGMNGTTFEQTGCDFQVNVSYINDARGRQIGHIEVVQDVSKVVQTQKAQADLLVKIREASGIFVNASRQIADGSQTLAQGSTQQAAAVEQLSASIAEIAQMTKDNAAMAEKTAKLGATIKESAEKGSGQMDEMMAAVREINQASQSIGKVIKVIDDIAFQTNILALNAAVEAARAGQHGKGFAVVAEEVRNLASKSAAAAKDTGNLIQNSIEKAELGSRIADETAVSLSEIVEGINESSRLVVEIAKSSGEQSSGIAEINKGIEQVAQVVQQNSATAEESAAASEEMNTQANHLADLTATFDAQQGLSGGGSQKQLAMPERGSNPPGGSY